MIAHLVEGLLGDCEAQLLLGRGEREPDLAPGPKPSLNHTIEAIQTSEWTETSKIRANGGGKELGHLHRGIPTRQPTGHDGAAI